MAPRMNVFTKVPLIEIEDSVFSPLYKPFVPEVDTQSTQSKDSTIVKRQSTNRKSIQQCFLIGLLARYGYHVTIKRLYKTGKKQMQLFIINSIVDKNGYIIYQNKATSLEKSKRKDLDAEMNNILIAQMEREINGKCIFTNGKQATMSKQFKIIKNISIGSAIIGEDIISHSGEILYQYLFKKNSLSKNDFVINSDDHYVINEINTQLQSLNQLQNVVHNMI